ncbi:unnamed protein product, partial [Brassica rapa]
KVRGIQTTHPKFLTRRKHLLVAKQRVKSEEMKWRWG